VNSFLIFFHLSPFSSPYLGYRGRLLLALELRAAHWYWQMGESWSPYPGNFSASRMAGVVGSTDTKVAIGGVQSCCF
jgi:hypothetical protein